MRIPLLAMLLVLAPQARAETIALDAFLAGAEKCGESAAFADFRQDLIAKYSNDFGVKGARVDPKVVVRVPPAVAAAIGPARSSNKGEYTEVIVPVRGNWRGLALREIGFDFGNQNGISVWAFRFAAPRAEVARVFGADVAAAAKAFKLIPDDAGVVMSIAIPKGKAEIVCDNSN